MAKATIEKRIGKTMKRAGRPQKMRPPETRLAHVNFLARRSLRQFQLQLASTPVAAWPKPLADAWLILTGKPGLAPTKALGVIFDSASAAHACIRAQNEQLKDLEEIETRRRIRKTCNRVANGISRGPAELRRRLDRAILKLIHEEEIDLEVIEAIFDATTKTFDEFADRESTSSAARALRELRAAHFFALSMALRCKTEKAIADLVAASSVNSQTLTADVFTTIARVLHGDIVKGASAQNSKSITSFVAELVAIWRRAGLSPRRAFGYLNPNYKSQFHVFADLVLKAMANPRAEHLPKQPLVHPRPEQFHSEQELVSDHHLRTALRG
jgi:hypothetical protein